MSKWILIKFIALIAIISFGLPQYYNYHSSIQQQRLPSKACLRLEIVATWVLKLNKLYTLYKTTPFISRKKCLLFTSAQLRFFFSLCAKSRPKKNASIENTLIIIKRALCIMIYAWLGNALFFKYSISQFFIYWSSSCWFFTQFFSSLSLTLAPSLSLSSFIVTVHLHWVIRCFFLWFWPTQRLIADYSELNAYINLLNECVYTSAWLMAITISEKTKWKYIIPYGGSHVRMLKTQNRWTHLMDLFIINLEQNENLMATYYQEWFSVPGASRQNRCNTMKFDLNWNFGVNVIVVPNEMSNWT